MKTEDQSHKKTFVYKILIVDENQTILDTYCTYLKASDFEIFTAGSAEQARAIVQDQTFDLIITDLLFDSIPAAIDPAREKGRETDGACTKVILVTDPGDSRDSPPDGWSGSVRYLEKPVDFSELPNVVRSILPLPPNPVPGFLRRKLKIWHRNIIRSAQLTLDFIALVSAFWLAYLLRFDFSLTWTQVQFIIAQLPLVLLIQFSALILTGINKFVWRYIGFRETQSFVAAAIYSLIPLLVLRLVLPPTLQFFRIPISVIIMDTVLGVGAILMLRIIRRAVYEKFQKMKLQNDSRKEYELSDKPETHSRRAKQVLLIGAGQAGLHAAREIINRGDSGLSIIGFIDDDPTKLGLLIHGIEVLGNTDQLSGLVRKHAIDHVIITIANAKRTELADIVRKCERVPIKMRIIPGLFDLLDGKVEINRIRAVEIEDLLGRQKVNLDIEAIQNFLAHKRIMVTGAGGSIGSELVRQVIKFSPEKILMVERCEYALYSMHKEICQSMDDTVCVPLIADIGDERRMENIFDRYHPQVILHAAAHKHVPLMEHNPTEAIKNNALATWSLGTMAGIKHTEVFVLISSDKAVNPTSIMGASKRIAELFVQNLNNLYETRYLAVRFGNVLGSTGSVIPLFKEQIRQGGPVTITHPMMTRYFMTISEAAQLVLQASTMGEGAEIFVLDMGEPVRIVDLAESMIRLSGLKPHQDIPIRFTGMRPGEKLFEELNTSDDHASKTRHSKIYIGKIKAFGSDEVESIVENLQLLARNNHENDLIQYVQKVLPEAALSATSR